MKIDKAVEKLILEYICMDIRLACMASREGEGAGGQYPTFSLSCLPSLIVIWNMTHTSPQSTKGTHPMC